MPEVNPAPSEDVVTTLGRQCHAGGREAPKASGGGHWPYSGGGCRGWGGHVTIGLKKGRDMEDVIGLVKTTLGEIEKMLSTKAMVG